MKIDHYKNIELEKITDPKTKGVTKRVLISPKDGAPNFTMRMFHVEPGGYTFHHSHDFEHEVFIVEGKGLVISENGSTPVEKGFSVLIEPGEIHQIKNTGETELTFLCLIPNQK